MMNRAYVWVLIAGAPSMLAAQTPRAGGANADVPVTKVMLFSSGVGYFEHSGSVRGNGATELRFKTNQINDILKSLVLQDQDGGHVGAITYPSQDPVAKTLKSFQVDITGNPSLAGLLNQLRGARVTIQAQAERITGTVLGVESRRKPAERGDAVDVPVLNVLTGATIRAVELPSISGLSLDDPQLQDELSKALEALVQSRDQDKKPVTINFTGTGERRVRIGYVVETPVWKTSYRLLLDDKGSKGRLQGWAIVENQTESDWNNVSLSLVSGRPISFMMDLYQPLYSTRPTVVPELFAGLRPQVYDGGIAADKARSELQTGEAGGRGGGNIQIRGPAGRPDVQTLGQVVVTAAAATSERASAGFAVSSVESMAAAARLGELFQYAVPNVTLARQKSAMLPIIADSVSLERVSIYNASVLRSNPLNGVLLRNTTGKHLLQGPLTVLDKGGYAGDARIDNVPPGQERLLSFGIDLDIVVDNTKSRDTSTVVTAKIVKGALIVSRKLTSTIEYAADNRSDRDKTLIIEHPARAGWKLVSTPKPAEATQSVYRFKGVAGAEKVTTLVVAEEYVAHESIAMLSADIGQLQFQSRTGEIPQAVRDAIARAIQLKQSALDLEQQITVHSQRLSEITAEQNRIRENMKTVAQSTQYYDRLLTKLNEQETSIESLEKERDALIARRDSLRRQLEEYLNSLNVG
jgi:hypothetical protein